MKHIKLVLYSAIACTLLFAACKKTVNGPTLTPLQKALTGRVWRLQSLTVPQKSDPSKDSSIIQPCADSALLAFDVYGSFQLADRSKNGCDSTVVPYDQGIWGISSDSDSLLLKGKRTFKWKLEKLNDTIIIATFRDSISPIKNWLKKITLK
ncbi:MAG: hypothetical protein ABI185_11035 [Ginsengibacter sp.]